MIIWYNSSMEREYKILKEIQEQALVAKHMFFREHEKEVTDAVSLINKTLNDDGEIYLVGSGSSYHSVIYASHLFAKSNHFITTPILAGDFESYVPDMGKNDLVVIVSQGGNNPTLLDSFHFLSQRTISTIIITNDADSPLANRSDLILPLEISREEAIPATKSYFAELFVFSLISEALKDGSSLFRLKDDLLSEIDRVTAPQYFDKLDEIAKYIAKASELFVLGEGLSYANAQEAALKLKECALLNADAYIASEFLHGPITLLKKHTPVIIFSGENNEMCQEVAEKIKQAGGAIIVVGPKNISFSEAFIPVKDLKSFSDLISIIPLQLLAYKTAIIKGLNPDKPPGLEKIVEI